MTKTKVELGLIQETLLIPLCGTTCELQQLDPIISEPKSVGILEAIDDDFDKFATAKTSQRVGCLFRMSEISLKSSH